jgi:hypothetical protein
MPLAILQICAFGGSVQAANCPRGREESFESFFRLNREADRYVGFTVEYLDDVIA